MSQSSRSTVGSVEEIEEQEYVSDSFSDTDDDPDDVDIEGEESDYIDQRPFNASHFDLIKKLGSGAYGVVFLVKKNCGMDANKIYAMKVINKDHVCETPKSIVHMKTERKVLELIKDCPYILKLYYAFQTADKLFLVTDYVPGGEMFGCVQKGELPEERVLFYIAELIVALEHIHKHGIAYRDIKLENILIDAEGHIKLVDFGLCKKLGTRMRSKSFCGTEEYMAPEIIACTGHNTAADWWAIGVLAIELLTTVTPFGTNTVPHEIMNRITNEEPIMPANASPEMLDFIAKMLKKNPAERLGGSDALATEIKEHPVFSDIDWDKLEKKQIPAVFIPTISHPYDTDNFSPEFTQQPASYEESEVPDNSFLIFKGYSYIAEEVDPERTEIHYVDDSFDENLNSLCWDIFSNREKGSKFDQKYKFSSPQPLGKGKLSVCMKCTRLSDHTDYAVKIYKRHCQNDIEIDLLQKAASTGLTGVLHLVEVLTDSTWTYLIMELIDGMNLLEFFSKMSLNGQIVYQTFNALWKIVKSVHSLKYAHGRLCFKNFCYLEKSSEFRLIGFKNARPITKARDEQIDYWSFGVCIYTVLCGHSPFDLLKSNATAVIESNDFDQLSDQWSDLSSDIKSFINQLLCDSIPTCSTGELVKIINTSVYGVTCSEAQIDENERIVAIRAAKQQNHLAIETKPTSPMLNGVAKVTNGSSDALDVKGVDTKMEKLSVVPESHSNRNEVNGHVTAPTKRRRNKIAAEDESIENGHIKRRKENSDELVLGPLFTPNQIKAEPRELRKKPAVDYVKKLNPRSRGNIATKKFAAEKEAQNKVKVEQKSPKNSSAGIKSPRGRGRPRKFAQSVESEPVQNRQERNDAPTIQENHSVPNGSKRQPKQNIQGRVDNTESSSSKPKLTNQATQTNWVSILPSQRPARPIRITERVFERFNY